MDPSNATLHHDPAADGQQPLNRQHDGNGIEQHRDTEVSIPAPEAHKLAQCGRPTTRPTTSTIGCALAYFTGSNDITGGDATDEHAV